LGCQERFDVCGPFRSDRRRRRCWRIWAFTTVLHVSTVSACWPLVAVATIKIVVKGAWSKATVLFTRLWTRTELAMLSWSRSISAYSRTLGLPATRPLVDRIGRTAVACVYRLRRLPGSGPEYRPRTGHHGRGDTTVDTGREFAEAGRPTFGQDRPPVGRESPAPEALDECATSVIIGFGPPGCRRTASC